MAATRRTIGESVGAVHRGAVHGAVVGKRRRAVGVLGAWNVHARVLGEEAVGLEENTDVLHGHAGKR